MSTGPAKERISRLTPVPAATVIRRKPLAADLPSLPQPNVARAHLVDRLMDPAFGSTACVLIAPAGFGKTTLLTQIALLGRQAGHTAAWLTLTAEHSSSERLLSALYEVFRLDPPENEASFRALTQQLDAQGSAMLFLDQLEVLTDPAALMVIVQLVESLHDCRVFVAGRTSGKLKLSRLTLAGRVRLIGARDLVFSAEDVKALSVDLTVREAAAIAQQTEGWPVAARAAMRKRRAETATDDSDVPAILGRYIEENVLADLDAECTRMLMEAAVFERFSVALLSEVPERAYACGDLAQLTERNVPIQAIDSQFEWFQFYPSFRSLLRQRLRRLDPARSRQLHRYAAGWFERNGYPVEAVRHATQCADTEMIACVMERVGAMRLSLHQGVSMLRLPHQLSLSAAPDYPLVTLGQIYLKVHEGRIEEARAHFERLRTSTRSFETLVTGVRAQDVRNFLDLMEILLIFYEDREIDDALIHLLEQHLKAVVDDDPAMVATVASMLSIAYMGVGRIEDSCNMADIGLASLRGVHADYVTFYLEVQQASATLALGRLREAALHTDRALAVANRAFGPQGLEEKVVNALKGLVHYENNELDAAERLLRDALGSDIFFGAPFDLYAAVFSAAVETAAVLHHPSAVDAILSIADTIAVQRRLPRLAMLVTLLRMSAAIAAGNLPYAMNLMHGKTISELLAPPTEPVSAWSMKLRTLALLESARLLNRLARARDAAGKLADVDQRYLRAGDARTRFMYQELSMEVAFQLHRNEAAATYFSEALDLALESGFVRRLLNCREQILQVFDWMMASGRPVSSRVVEYCASALRDAESQDSRLEMHKRLLPRRRTGPPAGSNLTPRETEILAMIAEGLSTKEIAHRLFVTTSTVKTHRRNVFEKLGAARRSQAIARAREQMII